MGGGHTKPVQEYHKKTIAADTSKYGATPAYWDKRYIDEAPFQFDWLQRYGHYTEQTELRKIILEVVPKRGYILNLGAGTSRMSEEMNLDGYLTILNVDVSGTAVRLMTEHYKGVFGKWSYRVDPGCRRLYARRTPEHGNATDTQLFQVVLRSRGRRMLATGGWLQSVPRRLERRARGTSRAVPGQLEPR